jgi:hypothetical protein
MPALPRLALRPTGALLGLGRRAATWPVASQQGSRRNAMLAATEIRHRRQEQLDVEDFLAALRHRRSASTTDAKVVTG